MNNKGQVLILFVILLPILLIITSFFILKIYFKIEKDDQIRILDDLCNYYIKNKDIDKTMDYANRIDNNLVIRIDKKNEGIRIKASYQKTILGKKKKIETIKICK